MRRFLLVFSVGLLTTCTVLLFASSGYAAPLAQALLPNFIMRAQTTITVTVSLADGQTVRVPVALDFTTRHEEVGGYLLIDAHVDQQPSVFIAVDDSGTISASMQAIVYSTSTPQPVAIAPTLPPPTPTLAPIAVVLTATPTQGPPTPPPAPTLAPVAQPIPSAGPTIAQVCDANTNDMTDPQIATFANQYVGQSFTGWETWVFDVVSQADGTYNLQLSKVERWPFWGRNIVVENIPTDLATRLNVNQKLILSGRIARNEIFLDSICNPLVVDNFTVQE